ncbi:RidA family protein [Polyangium sp. 15x6]|uniref:RidA family protein n=1 Tax=Polyangium sp. 15x6 TaxID=3042687 RepID=UPI00249A0CD2|nr:RidA family protein [Polyangium sp. 15x6]MDI3291679.1 RidA family protein [Polyangium sp. 15x6]
MPKTIISTNDAPAAIGPYSQGTRAGNLVFCSGQIPIDPKTGELVAGGIEAQTKQALANLGAVLRAAGASWPDVVRTTIWLVDLGDFAVVNRIYGEVVGAEPPARVTIQVSALPKGAAVEIDAIAHV